MSSVILQVSLSQITTSHNPRRPCPVLQDSLTKEGYENYTPLRLVQELALSDDAAKKAEFCRLIETYEGETVTDGLVNLAKSRAGTELQPIVLRDFRSQKGGEYVTRYGIVCGERRVLAAAYNHAKHGLPAEVGSQVRKLTVTEAFNLAVEENSQRRQMTDMDYGRIFHSYRSETNPATDKKWTLKEIAATLKLDYQFVRSREALVYLPETDQRRLESGKASGVSVTKATRKGLAIKQGKSVDGAVADKKKDRLRVLSLKEVQALFDKKRTETGVDPSSRKAYLLALADVMQCTIAKATKESEQRLDAAELQAAKAVEREVA